MKKIVLSAVLATAALAASAVEVGITTTADYSNSTKATATGFTIGQNFGKVSVAGGYQHFSAVDRYTVTAGYDIAKVGSIIVTPKLGAAYLNNATGVDGSAIIVGIGATLPLTKTVSFTLDAERQYGQDRVQGADGNRVTAGLKYRF